ncbi:ABC transporter permease [Microbacterium sp. APC 3898]|uniref:ABC transporter permease n=1 Tax=Planococcus notacanthi TaxID=3035188 RepID=A0ABT7ZMS4_9BACL|nr:MULTISPECIES: ABC transporter permease [Terrabacteria group]MDN3428408.1 ABC transporter permease [Planococcus sp. APC 4016]MDN3498885.1 ABC transporter permease [Microbacterium sp. APC 3898]
MKALTFAQRNRKEILRDPMTLLFGMVLPVLMLWLFSMMAENMPFDLFTLEKLAPAIIVFSFSFITLFTGMLIGRDKSSSFLMRIFASPMAATDYLIGYALPLLPVALIQMSACYGAALLLGMPFTYDAIPAFGLLVIISFLYIAFGLFFGTVFTDRQVGAIFAIFVNVTTWFSGTWFGLDMIGGTFETVAYLLPFAHAVDAVRAAFAGNYSEVFIPMLWVIAYTVVIFGVAVWGFRKRMRG